MKIGKLTNGKPFFALNITQLVTASTFATALADDCWHRSEPFNVKLRKKDAKIILYKGLYNNGQQGILSDGQLESATDIGEEYNLAYDDAYAWVLKNYAYLTPTNNNTNK